MKEEWVMQALVLLGLVQVLKVCDAMYYPQDHPEFFLELQAEMLKKRVEEIPSKIDFDFYTKSQPDIALKKSHFSGGSVDLAGKKVKVLTHGYPFSMDSIGETGFIPIKDTIFETQKDVDIVVVVDWVGATPGNLVDAQYAARTVVPVVASEVNKILQVLKNDGVSPLDMELVGHSMGAHISGQACRKFYKETGQKCGKVVALDPAGRMFKGEDMASSRLSKDDAKVVETINTDKILGYYEKLGHHNEFPDMNDICNKDFLKTTCRHSAAKEIYKRKLKGESFGPWQNSTTPLQKKAPSVHNLAVILVLDVSRSMYDHGRHLSLQSASKSTISSLRVNSSIGIVTFNGGAYVNLAPMRIIDEGSKQTAIAAVPHSFDGGTSIGAGLRAAINMMNSYKDMECAQITLITDGEENSAPMISDVIDEIPDCSRVQPIGLGDSASKSLELLSSKTGGKVSSVSDLDSCTKLLKTEWDSTYAGLPPSKRPIRLPVKQVELKEMENNFQDFFIDKGMLKNNHWLLSHPNYANLNPFLKSPSGIKYGGNDFIKNSQLQALELKLKKAEPGIYKLKLDESNGRRKKRSSGSNVPLVIFVTSDPIEEESVVIDATLTSNTLDYSIPGNVTIMAKLLKGEDVIIRADVRAEIASPTDENEVTEVILRDDGVGADAFKDDGVYSRFLTEPLKVLGNSLRYEVTVIAKGGGNSRIRTFGDGDPALDILGEDEVKALEESGEFEREITAGSVRPINDYIEPEPAAIRDLKVEDINLEKKTVTLSWTATGLNLDEGTALSNNLTAVMKSYSHTFIGRRSFLNKDEVIAGSLDPLPSGSLQNVTVKIPDVIWKVSLLEVKENVNFPFIYFNIRSKGHGGRMSEISNVASTEQFVLRLPPPMKSGGGWKLCSDMKIIVSIFGVIWSFLN